LGRFYALLGVVLVVGLAASPHAGSTGGTPDPAGWPPWDFVAPSAESLELPDAPDAVGPASFVFRSMMHFYSVVVSPVSGKHCPMHPSCSAYAREAVSRKGLPLGVLMAFDRLHRCGHDLRFYELVYLDGAQLRYDPVEAE
jgi:hypothetical protein